MTYHTPNACKKKKCMCSSFISLISIDAYEAMRHLSVYLCLFFVLTYHPFYLDAFKLRNLFSRFVQPQSPKIDPSSNTPIQAELVKKVEPSNEPIPLPWKTLSGVNNASFAISYSFKELDEKKAGNFRQLPVARFVSWALRKLVNSRTEYVQGLDIKVISESNREIIRGKLDAIDMKFDKISYASLYVSGGGRIIVKGLELRMRRFLFQNLQSVRKPYIIYADLLLTQQDVINSKLVRNLIQLLVNTILERVLSNNKILSASIRKVTINARRINAQGTAKLLSDQVGDSGLASVDFEVSTGAGMRDEGQTLYLKDIQVVLNPDSILRTVMPILTTTPIDIDLGEDCRIESLVIANKNIWIRAAAVISPLTPFTVAELRSKALYRYDLSQFLSSLLRLNGGIAMRWRGG